MLHQFRPEVAVLGREKIQCQCQAIAKQSGTSGISSASVPAFLFTSHLDNLRPKQLLLTASRSSESIRETKLFQNPKPLTAIPKSSSKWPGYAPNTQSAKWWRLTRPNLSVPSSNSSAAPDPAPPTPTTDNSQESRRNRSCYSTPTKRGLANTTRRGWIITEDRIITIEEQSTTHHASITRDQFIMQ